AQRVDGVRDQGQRVAAQAGGQLGRAQAEGDGQAQHRSPAALAIQAVDVLCGHDAPAAPGTTPVRVATARRLSPAMYGPFVWPNSRPQCDVSSRTSAAFSPTWSPNC